MKDEIGLKGKTLLCLIVLSLAIIYCILFNITNKGVDYTFLVLVILAVLILLFPWEYIKSLKAAGIELLLDQPPVKGALGGIKMERMGNRLLKEKLSELASEIEQVKGSRVLWVDDKPQEIIGERRLLRALGIEVVTAIDSESALRKIEEDNDFDIIISDAQRIGWGDKRRIDSLLFELPLVPLDYRKYLKDGAVDARLEKVFEVNKCSLCSKAEISEKDEKHWKISNDITPYIVEDTGTQLSIYEATILDGLYFVLTLRRSKDPVIKNIPVILYTAYTEENLAYNIGAVAKGKKHLPETYRSDSIDTLLELVIKTLSDVRLNPISVKPKKEPTRAG